MILHYCIFLLFILFNFVISERGNYTFIHTKQETDLGPFLIKWIGIGLVAFMILYFLFRDDKKNAPEVERDNSNNNIQRNTYVGSKFRRHLRACKGFFRREKKQGSNEHEVFESEQNVQPSISTKDNIDADDNRTKDSEITETPKITEITTSESTSTIPSSKSIPEPDEITEKTQSPYGGLQSPTSISVEMSSPPPPLQTTNKKERTKLGYRPETAAEVVTVLAKHRESDDWRLPNERFELINEEESPKKLSTTTSSPAITTSSTNLTLCLQNSKTLDDSNDPFLTNNPYWRSRTERVTQIGKLRSPNTGRINEIEVKSKETAIDMPDGK